ncbi:MAG: PHP domain-containing protein [Clostridiales bacterium]|jgi:predicted metal-dependent phosphoesterase TrpH|nr:PHP domain-containing protein [Clostridiales bacterium]
MQSQIFDKNADPALRLETLQAIAPAMESMELSHEYVNNHIHTTYSFSPYTPAAAVYAAKRAGLSTAGIMDHDSVGGCREFLQAGEILSMPVTVGFECRTSVANTVLAGRRLNNPDQKSVAYVTLHGIPHQNLDVCEAVLRPLREKRNMRNRRMCEKINEIATDFHISIDFEKDVLPLSAYAQGGSVTERHLLYALAVKITDGTSRKSAIQKISALCQISPEDIALEKLYRAPEQFYLYDVLGILKSHLVSRIYIDADEELLHIHDFIQLANQVGGIAAYAYLGDVTQSPTGDKKAQQFEDSYLDLLFEELQKIGFHAVTYMPSRNSRTQLERVMQLCQKYGFFQISGEDINSPRQSFLCDAMRDYPHLIDATYALIGHEQYATAHPGAGMFSLGTEESLQDRIIKYAAYGRQYKKGKEQSI